MLAVQDMPSLADRADARCMLAMLTRANRKRPGEDVDTIYPAATFFMGKIAGRSGAAAVDRAGKEIEQEFAQMKDAEVDAITDRCIVEVKRTIPRR
jgi:hypothetical protein